MSCMKQEEAKQAIKDAETFITNHDYKAANEKLEEAINLHPAIENAQTMIRICKTLHICETHKYFRNKFWPYTFLQIPTSSTVEEVYSSFEFLMADLEALEGKFSGAAAAMAELDIAMSMYNEENFPILGYKERRASQLALILVGYDCMNKNDIAAKDAIKAIEDAKRLLAEEQFRSAKAKVDHAVKLFPSIKLGQQMQNVCNIYYYYHKHKQSCSEIWPYVFQIPSTAKESEVNARFKELMDDVRTLYGWPSAIRFPGLNFAKEALQQAMESYRRCNTVSADGDDGAGVSADKNAKKFPLQSNWACHYCGGSGNPDACVTCCICKISRVHTCCLLKKLVKVPEKWLCEKCMCLSSFQQEFPDHLAIQPTWMGSFDVHDSVLMGGRYEGLQAHFPQKVHRTAYRLANEMPNILQLKVCPRSNVWPEAFRRLPPTADDIALYFLPSDHERFRKSYHSFSNVLMTTDSAVHSSLDGWELLIFSSKQLPAHSQRINNQFFLWGVFQSKGKHYSSSKRPLLTPKREPGDDAPPGYATIPAFPPGFPKPRTQDAEHSQSKHRKNDSEEDAEEHKRNSVKSSAKKQASTVSSPEKDSSHLKSKNSKVESSRAGTSVASSSKEKVVETAERKVSALSNPASNETARKENAGKKLVEGKDERSKGLNPSDDELRCVIAQVLGAVDRTKATFSDIFKILAAHYGMDFTPRKKELKRIIEDELMKLADDDEEDDGEPRKEDSHKPAAKRMKT